MDKKVVEEFAAKSLWSLDEFCYICIGLKPGAAKNEDHAVRYNKAYEEINRGCLAGTLKYTDPSDAERSDRLYGHARFFRPVDAIAWAKARAILFPAFPGFPQELLPEEKSQTDNDLSKTERNSLLKMVLGMAMSKYEYEPDAVTNKATGDKAGSINADLEDQGIGLDKKTIKYYLDEAKERFREKLPKKKT